VPCPCSNKTEQQCMVWRAVKHQFLHRALGCALEPTCRSILTHMPLCGSRPYRLSHAHRCQWRRRHLRDPTHQPSRMHDPRFLHPTPVPLSVLSVNPFSFLILRLDVPVSSQVISRAADVTLVHCIGSRPDDHEALVHRDPGYLQARSCRG
jgi:hypothetical protein